jgi:hypothetical protein
MGRSRGQRVKALEPEQQDDMFWMSLEEAKRAMSDKYDFLVERYERREIRKPI